MKGVGSGIGIDAEPVKIGRRGDGILAQATLPELPEGVIEQLAGKSEQSTAGIFKEEDGTNDLLLGAHEFEDGTEPGESILVGFCEEHFGSNDGKNRVDLFNQEEIFPDKVTGVNGGHTGEGSTDGIESEDSRGLLSCIDAVPVRVSVSGLPAALAFDRCNRFNGHS